MGRKKKSQIAEETQSKGAKLTVDMVVDHEKQYEETTNVTFDDGNYVDIYKKFNPIKIEQTIMELSKFTQELRENDIVLEDDLWGKLYILHIVLNFSTLGESVPKDINTKFKVFKYLVDSEYVNKIRQSFDVTEFNKAINALGDKFKLIADKMNTDEKFKKEMLDKLKEISVGQIEINEVDEANYA